MANTVKHKFQSTKADGPDTSLLRPSNWNDEHSFSGGVTGNQLVRDASQSDGVSWVDYQPANLTNRTGGQLVTGDVVTLSAANDDSVVLDDMVGSFRPYVVAQATIEDLSAGLFAIGGSITSVKAQGAINRGEYVKKSATAKAVETTGTVASAGAIIPPGTLGVALSNAAAGLVAVHWFGVTKDKVDSVTIGLALSLPVSAPVL